MNTKSRMVQTRFWEDNFIVELEPLEKHLFMYFLTSPLSNICGIYECPIRRIIFDTGITDDTLIKQTFKKFEGRIHYIDGWIYIRNFAKNQSQSPTIQKAIQNELAKVPEAIRVKIRQIEKMYEKIDMPSFLTIEEQQEQKKKKKKRIPTEGERQVVNEIYKQYVDLINPSTRLTEQAVEKILTRLDTFSSDDLKTAILKFSQDDWRMTHNADNGMKWFFSSDEQISKWLGLKIQTPTNTPRIKI